MASGYDRALSGSVVPDSAKFGVSADAMQSLGMKYEIFRQGS
jgi:hypothetical protein